MADLSAKGLRLASLSPYSPFMAPVVPMAIPGPSAGFIQPSTASNSPRAGPTRYPGVEARQVRPSVSWWPLWGR